eukprot:7215176-Karenia_brevis.AAC.1
MGQQIRKVRKFFKRKGKGKGKQRFAFLAQMPEEEIGTLLYGKGGKGKFRKSSGEGLGRRGNPYGRDGNQRTCHGCNSTDHL